MDEKASPNGHCFKGSQNRYWRSKANGFSPALPRVQDEGPLEMKLDSDGAALQNGGLAQPSETRMPPRIYYRFIGTRAYTQSGPAKAMAGNWWIEAEGYFTIRDWAHEQGISVAKAAQRLIVIPDAWHDCAYVGRAVLSQKLKAYVGKGKPAAGVSPYNPRRDRDTQPIQMAPGHINIKQWFVPGNPELLKQYFQVLQVVKCSEPGIVL